MWNLWEILQDMENEMSEDVELDNLIESEAFQQIAESALDRKEQKAVDRKMYIDAYCKNNPDYKRLKNARYRVRKGQKKFYKKDLKESFIPF